MMEKDYMPEQGIPGDIGPRRAPDAGTPRDPNEQAAQGAAVNPVLDTGGTGGMGVPQVGEERSDLSPDHEDDGPEDRLGAEIRDVFSTEAEAEILEINAILTNTESNADAIVAAAQNLGGVPPETEAREAFAKLLRDSGQDEEKIREVMSRADEFRPSESESEETPEEREEAIRAMGDNGPLEDLARMVDESKGLNGKVARGEEVTEEEMAKFLHDSEAAKGRVHNFLFDQETGLLREGKRFSRLAVKPTVVILLATLLLYTSLLHVATGWATKRVGGGK